MNLDDGCGVLETTVVAQNIVEEPKPAVFRVDHVTRSGRAVIEEAAVYHPQRAGFRLDDAAAVRQAVYEVDSV